MEENINNFPKVSVVIPTYNRASFVVRAAGSVLKQTYVNIEIVVVDGSPNKETEEALIHCFTDSRLKYLHQDDVHTGSKEDRGKIAKARNAGIRSATGKYISCLDDDDFWQDLKKLEKQMQFLEQNKDYVICGGAVIVVNQDNPQKPLSSLKLYPEKDEDIRKSILIGDVFTTSTVVFRKEAWEAVGGYDEEHPLGEDWDLYLKFGKIGKMYNFQEPFVQFSLGEQNIPLIAKYARECVKNAFSIMWKYRNDYPGFWRAFLFNLAIYIYGFIPSSFRRFIKPLRTKVKHFWLKKLGVNENAIP